MRRRFGRRRRRSDEGRGAPIESQWLERIAATDAIAVSALEPLRYEDIPDHFALTAVGRGDAGERCVVGFSPHSGGDALLAAVVAGARDTEGDLARVIAVSPHWDAGSRRRLALFTQTTVPVKALAMAPPGGAEVSIEPEPIFEPSVVPVARVLDGLEQASQRALFERALNALQGLAAKHGGAVRGVRSSVELAILGRRVAILRANDGVFLDILISNNASVRLSEAGFPDVLDRLEGFIRKHLNDKRIRDGEEGARGRLIPSLIEVAGLRHATRWPVGGSDLDVIDLVGVAQDGCPVVAVVRQRLHLGAVAGILDAVLSLETAMPTLLAGAAGPVRLTAPRLLVAVSEIDAAASCVLGQLTLDTRCYEVTGRPPNLALRERAPERAATAAPIVVAPVSEERDEPQRPQEAAEAEPAERSARSGRGGRGRGRGGRGRRRAEGRGGSVEDEEAQAPEEAAAERSAPRFEEISLFDLDSDEDSEPESESGSRRRGRGRGRSRGRGRGRRSENDGRPAERGRPTGPRGSDDVASGDEEAADAFEAGGSRDRRPEGGAPVAGRDEDDLDLIGDPEDSDELVQLSPDVPDFEETEEPVYDEEDLEEEPLTDLDRMRLEREKRRLARHSAMAPPTPHSEEPESQPQEEVRRPPRGRAVILAHADRQSIIAATLLARDVRQIEGVWIYPQSELMTFFRSVTTDLRENMPIFVIGFSASPARDTIQAASLYRDRIVWFDHHLWAPEDLDAMKTAIGEHMLHVEPGSQNSLASVLSYCTRRSRFSDKLVDLATGRFTQHDYERWGRLWWWRLGELARETGEQRAALELLLVGRPSDLAKEAAKVSPPPPPPEVEFVASRDFRLVHFSDFGIVIGALPHELDLQLTSRILRERYGVQISLVHAEGDDLLVIGADDVAGRRAIDVGAMADHLSEKFEWVVPLTDEDHVARFRIREMAANPDRLEEVVREIGLGRSILEG